MKGLSRKSTVQKFISKTNSTMANTVTSRRHHGFTDFSSTVQQANFEDNNSIGTQRQVKLFINDTPRKNKNSSYLETIYGQFKNSQASRNQQSLLKSATTPNLRNEDSSPVAVEISKKGLQIRRGRLMKLKVKDLRSFQTTTKNKLSRQTDYLHQDDSET